MPVYNAEAYLAEAVESALGQTEKNIEVVAVDDGSTDSSREILRRYAGRDPRLRILEEEHRGLIAALNRGLEVAQGEYICRLDADDIAMPDRVDRQVRFLQEHLDYVLVGGQVATIGSAGEDIGTVGTQFTGLDLAEYLKAGCCLVHSSVAFRRAEVLSAGAYDPLFVTVEDYDLWVRLVEDYRLAKLPEIVCKFRVHGDQVSVSRILRQYLSTMCIRAAFRGATREAIRDGVRADEKDFLKVLRQLGYSDDEIAANLTNTFLHWTGRLRSAGNRESASKLLLELKGYIQEMRCDSRFLAQAHWWHSRLSLDAHCYTTAAQFLFRAAASSPRVAAKRLLGRLLAPLSSGRRRAEATLIR
jgi:glycosyltransferase involved in cell wall biosynthesis